MQHAKWIVHVRTTWVQGVEDVRRTECIALWKEGEDAPGNGGAVYGQRRSRITIYNSTFMSNFSPVLLFNTLLDDST